jgi:zinc transport system substrate-binding protein
MIHTHNHHHGTDEESLGIDPHFWVDPLTVRAMLPALLNELIKIDPENEEYFRSNEKLFFSKALRNG